MTVIGVLIYVCLPNFIKIGSWFRPPDAHNCRMFNAWQPQHGGHVEYMTGCNHPSCVPVWPQICEILRFCDLFCFPVLAWLYFFSRNSAQVVYHWTDFNHLWLKWRVVTQGCAFWGFGWRPIILRGSKPPKTPKNGAWLGIFSQNGKIIKLQYLWRGISDRYQILTK